jgi:hypothetical protein
MDLRSAPHICLLALSLSLVNTEVTAKEAFDRASIWGGVDIGRGNFKTSGDVDKDETALYLGFKVGYRFNPHYLVGLELSGWILESSNLWDPNKGEGISQVLIFTQLYPNIGSDYFVKLGGGYVSHWNNRLGEPAKKSGWGITLGGGYDFRLYKDWAITPFVTISHARTDNEVHNAWALGIGMTRQF